MTQRGLVFWRYLKWLTFITRLGTVPVHLVFGNRWSHVGIIFKELTTTSVTEHIVNMLYLQFLYLAVCLSIATVEIYLFVIYKTTKPAVFTTLSDMVSCDLSIIFLTLLYLAAASSLLPYVKIEIRPLLACLFAPTGTCLTLICVFYLFAKSLVEYFQLRLRVVDLAEEYQQEDLLLFVRLTIVFVATSFTVWIHIGSGVSAMYYFMTESDVTPEALLHSFLIMTLSSSFSCVCLILKLVTRNKKGRLLGELRKKEHAKPLICNYYIGILIIFFLLFAVVVSFIINTSMTHFIFTHCVFGICATLLPAFVICQDLKLRKIVFKYLKRKLPV